MNNGLIEILVIVLLLVLSAFKRKRKSSREANRDSSPGDMQQTEQPHRDRPREMELPLNPKELQTRGNTTATNPFEKGEVPIDKASVQPMLHKNIPDSKRSKVSVQEADGVGTNDDIMDGFDLKKAVIYQEILSPKYKEYTYNKY